MDEIRPVVKKRPQTLVGEAVVVAIEFFGGQIDGQQIDPVNGLRLRVASRVFSGGLAAPAKPQAAMRRECLRDGDGQSTGLAILPRVGDTVGRDDETAAFAVLGSGAALAAADRIGERTFQWRWPEHRSVRCRIIAKRDRRRPA